MKRKAEYAYVHENAKPNTRPMAMRKKSQTLEGCCLIAAFHSSFNVGSQQEVIITNKNPMEKPR